jgi:hypothetical protein
VVVAGRLGVVCGGVEGPTTAVDVSTEDRVVDDSTVEERVVDDSTVEGRVAGRVTAVVEDCRGQRSDEFLADKDPKTLV